MKYCFSILIVLLCYNGFSQDTLKQRGYTKQYVTIQNFKKTGKSLTEKDSLNWIIIKEDTLVEIDERYPGFLKEGVEVPYESRDEEFLNLYRQVVFNSTDGSAGEGTIKIWKDGIRLFFDKSVPKKHKREMLHFINLISSGIDSLKISEAKEISNANYIIFYLNKKEDFDLEPRISSNIRGGFHVDWNENQELTRGILKINTFNMNDTVQHLNTLKHQFFKSLGNFYFSPELHCESFLSKCSDYKILTKDDLEILKYHYSYGMCKGIDLNEFNRIHKEFKASLEKEPNIKLYMLHHN